MTLRNGGDRRDGHGHLCDGFLAHAIPDALGNILVASVISTPAAVAVAALMVPFARADETRNDDRCGSRSGRPAGRA